MGRGSSSGSFGSGGSRSSSGSGGGRHSSSGRGYSSGSSYSGRGRDYSRGGQSLAEDIMEDVVEEIAKGVVRNAIRGASYNRRSTYSRSKSSNYGYNNTRSVSSSNTGIPVGAIIVLIMIVGVIWLFTFITGKISAASEIANTTNRTKLSTGSSFSTNFLDDTQSWIRSKKTLEKGLRVFWDKTGVQPYIMIMGYNPNLSEAEMESLTKQKYTEVFSGREDAFVYAVWDTSSSDNLDGYYYTWYLGAHTKTLMDSEAMDIFWNIHDNYWYGTKYGNGKEDKMYAAIYTDTANSIMEKDKTIIDIVIALIVCLVVVVVCISIIILITKKHKREKEKAAETERILNADLDTLSSSEDDDLINKYM